MAEPAPEPAPVPAVAERATERATEYGTSIDRLHADPWAPKIVFKPKRHGCCYPPTCYGSCCPGGKHRAYAWIGEASFEENYVNPCGCDCSRRKTRCCMTCSDNTDDIIKLYYDQDPFVNDCYCCCPEKRGIATSDQLGCLGMPWCCKCYGCYGESLHTVCCDEEDMPGPFWWATRCFPWCCTNPLVWFLEDAKEAKRELLQAMGVAAQRKEADKEAKAPGAAPSAAEGAPAAAPEAAEKQVTQTVEAEKQTQPIQAEAVSKAA